MKRPQTIVKQTEISQELADFVLSNQQKTPQLLPDCEVVILIRSSFEKGLIYLSDEQKEILNSI